MDEETIEGLAKFRLSKAKETLNTAELILKNGKDYTSANNRAYYAIFYAIRAVLALEQKDFKKHKDIIAYFNKEYVSKQIFPKKIGKKIAQAQKRREDSDYDDEYKLSYEQTENQINTAKEIIKLVEEYVNKNGKNN